MNTEDTKGEIVIYETPNNEIKLEVNLQKDTVWLTQIQIAKLFSVDRSVVTKHIGNVYKTGELDEKSNVQKMHIRNSDKLVKLYNLDTVISVGYRVNSRKATKFRIWATNTIKSYLVNGYVINEKRLLETKERFLSLQNTISFMQEKSKIDILKGQEGEILELLSQYAKTLKTLEEYDNGKIDAVKGNKATFILTYNTCLSVVGELRKNINGNTKLFGNQRNNSFESIVNNIYQTFGENELYPSIEDKAANLLYLSIKDHPFSDGNKRIASFLFVYFLDKNNRLYKKTGEKRINDNALTALALLVAESNPSEKVILINIIKSLIY